MTEGMTLGTRLVAKSHRLRPNVKLTGCANMEEVTKK